MPSLACADLGVGVDWRESSYSDGTGGQCIETASHGGLTSIRDTTNRDGVTPSVPAAAWATFVSSLR
jgi:hypothetical protein